MKPRLTPDECHEILRELMSTLGDNDTAAILVLRVQAGPDNEDPDVQILHMVVDGTNPRGLGELIYNAVCAFLGQLLTGELEHSPMRKDS